MGRAISIPEQRARCWAHALVRAAQREVDLTPARLASIEQLITDMRPAFMRPDENRYRLRIKHNRERLFVIYDAPLGCIVTVLR